MAGLFPRSQPRCNHRIAVGSGHELAVAEYGTAAGAPVLYLHGGPGGGTPKDLARLFDPATFRLVAFDQRGCGRSSCDDRLRDNTTSHLLADAEAVRVALGIDSWAVVGSSYGSLMTALYAARHPTSVRWAVLHGVFLGSEEEVGWLYREGGAARFYPQQWGEFENAANAANAAGTAADADAAEEPPPVVRATSSRMPLLGHFHDVLTRPSVPRQHPLPEAASVPAAALAAAAALTTWEDEMETLAPEEAKHEDAGELLAGAQIAAHYFAHGCFLPEAGALPELRAKSDALASVPCAIVHGRHDVVCPPRAASALHAAWPGATLRIVEGGAHALFEKPMRTAAQAALAELVAGPGGAAAHEHKDKRSRRN